MTFPGATTPRGDADYVLLGAPLDVSTTFQPGTRFGPRELRHYAQTFDDYDHHTELHFSELAVHDAGDVRAWDDAREYLDHLEGRITDISRDGAVPVLMGGEHTVSVAGVRAVEPDVFITVDAHLDLRAEYDGNPLSHATSTRRALETVDRAVILGARTGSENEWKRASEDDVTVVPPESVSEWTPDVDNESVYLSIDIDGVDPGLVPGTGTMEPFGLRPRTVRSVIRQVAPQAIGGDIVEVNDRDDGQAAALGAKLLRAIVYTHAAKA